MTVLTVAHAYHSNIGDGGDSTLVQPSNWNANHSLTIAGTSGGIPYFDTASSLASSGVLTANGLVLGGGAGAAPTSMTGTSGGVPYFNSATTVTSSAALTASAIVLGGGAGAAPTTLGSLGTTTTVLHGNASGAPSFGAVANADLANSTITIGTTSIALGASSTTLAGLTSVGLTSAGSINWNSDTTLYRDTAVGTFALADSVTATALRVYNTTDQVGTNVAPTNYERGIFDWRVNANTLTIGTQAGGSGTARNIRISAAGGFLIFDNSDTQISLGSNFGGGARPVLIGTQNITLGSSSNFRFSSSGDAIGGSPDTSLGRNAGGVLMLVNQQSSTSATGFQVYNTSDVVNGAPTNYERGVFDWTTNANVLTIGTQAGGTGTGRAIRIVGGSAKAASLYNFGVAPNTQTGSTYSVVDGDQWLIFNAGVTCTVTLPAASSYTGREITMKTIAAQTVVSASSNVAPANSATAGTAILAATAGKFATLVSDGTNWVIMQSN